MFSIAHFLDAAKARAGINSDYRLAKVIGITHESVSGFRRGKSLPNESTVTKLCALSGDDPDVIYAYIQESKAKNDDARAMWHRIAQRLQHGHAHAMAAFFAALIAILLIAPDASAAQAVATSGQCSTRFNFLYIVSIIKRAWNSLHRLRISFFPKLWRFVHQGLHDVSRTAPVAAS